MARFKELQIAGSALLLLPTQPLPIQLGKVGRQEGRKEQEGTQGKLETLLFSALKKLELLSFGV